MIDLAPLALAAPLLAMFSVVLVAMRWAPEPVARVEHSEFAPARSAPEPSPAELEPRRSPGADRLRRLARRARRRGCTIEPAAIAAWLDDLSRAARRGSTLQRALLDVVPRDTRLAEAVRPLHHHLGRGSTVADAVRRWTDDPADGPETSRHLHDVASVVRVCATVGGSISEPLDRTAAALRQHAADQLERDAQTAQARLSARVLTVVPLAVLGLLLVVEGDVRDTVTTPTGASVVGAGIVLNIVGARWMRRIIERNNR